MKWTEISSGQTNGAFQRFMVALGDEAETAVTRINTDPVFAERMATYAILGGIEPSTSHQKAREIMGANMFGVEEAMKHFGVNPSRRQLAALAEVPFSEKVLKSCKDTHVLVAVFPLSILKMRDKVERKLFYSHEDVWYKKQAFATDNGEVGWQLIHKEPVANSTNKNWNEQQMLLSKDEETPKAQIVVYTMVGHFLTTGERLFEKIYVRCLDLGSDGDRVNVGGFDSGGLVVSDYRNNGSDSSIGVSSVRK